MLLNMKRSILVAAGLCFACLAASSVQAAPEDEDKTSKRLGSSFRAGENDARVKLGGSAGGSGSGHHAGGGLDEEARALLDAESTPLENVGHRDLQVTTESPTVFPTLSPTAITVDVDELVRGFEDFTKAAKKFVPDGTDALEKPIPLIGKSFNELIGGEPGVSLASVLDLTEFVEYAKSVYNGSSDLTADQLKLALEEYFIRDGTGQLSPKTIDEMPNRCSGADPISVTHDGNVWTFTLCVDIMFSRSTQFSAPGLFDSFDGFVKLETDSGAEVAVKASLSVGADLKIDLKDSNDPVITITIDPLVGTLAVDAGVDFTVALGMLDVETAATVKAEARLELEICDDISTTALCLDEEASLDTPSKVSLTRTANYTLEGDISLSADDAFPGVANLLKLQDGSRARLTIADADVFDEEPPDVEVKGFDFLTKFQDFSPSNAVDMLRIADAALVRAQENPAFNVNLPITNKRFSDVLATGSVLTSKLLKYFVRPEPFNDREQKSLLILAEFKKKEPTTSAPTTGSLTDSPTRELEFFIFKATDSKELEVNPENFFELVKEESDVTRCAFSFKNAVEDTDDFVKELTDGLQGCVTVCVIDEIVGCKRDNITKDFFDCDCDVVIDNFEDADDGGKEKVLVASVAYDKSNQTKDVHLMGLYDAKENYTGPGDLFNFPLNQPVTPGLVPRFRNFKDLSNRIQMVIESEATFFSDVSVDFAYLPELPDRPPRFEVDMGFTLAVDKSASLEASAGLGDLVDIKIENTAVDISGSASFQTNFGVILGPDSKEQLVLIGNSCQGDGFDNCTTSTNKPYKVELFINGNENPVELDLTGDGSSYPFELLEAALAAKPEIGVVNVTKVGKSLLVLRFDGNVSEYNLQVPKKCFTEEGDEVIVGAPFFRCGKKETTEVVENDYGFSDAVLTKKRFQLALGPISLTGNVNASGEATIAANVGGVFEVGATLEADIGGTVDLTIGENRFLPVVDWLVAITKIFSNESAEGFIDDFLSANATFTGSFEGTVAATEPFNFGEITAKGSFAKPFEIDFLDVNASKNRPEIDFAVSCLLVLYLLRGCVRIFRFLTTYAVAQVDLPQIGNLRNLTFKDVIELLQMAIEFLIGDEDGDSVETCSGGLLGLEVLGKPIFVYRLPGKRLCIRD